MASSARLTRWVSHSNFPSRHGHFATLQRNGPLFSRHTAPHRHGARTLIYLPTILQPAFWRSLIPTFLRPGHDSAGTVKRKGRNPATFYIWMFLLIGSQGVQMLTLRGQVAKFSEETEARLSQLREVVKRIQAGEDVDVEAELGTGEAKSEREWEQVMRELEAEDKMYQSRRERQKARRAAREAAREAANGSDQSSATT